MESLRKVGWPTLRRSTQTLILHKSLFSCCARARQSRGPMRMLLINKGVSPLVRIPAVTIVNLMKLPTPCFSKWELHGNFCRHRVERLCNFIPKKCCLRIESFQKKCNIVVRANEYYMEISIDTWWSRLTAADNWQTISESNCAFRQLGYTWNLY